MFVLRTRLLPCLLLVGLTVVGQAALIRLRRKRWKSLTRSFVARAAKHHVPTVYRKPPQFRPWAAYKKWTNNTYLSQLVHTLDGVYVQDASPVFGPYFDAGRPLASSAKVRPLHNYSQISVPTHQFLSTSATATATPTIDPTFMYLTREIERIHPMLEQDITPFHELIRLGPSKSSINVWMGHNAVVAPCHYDSYHNVYAQIRGSKTFYMAPPTARTILKPYPFVHPSHAQCQVRLTPPFNAAFLGNNGGLDIYVAVLQPGDVLYLPPLWFHEVVAGTEMSMSVNGWTPAQGSMVVEQLFAVPLPHQWSNVKPLEREQLLSSMLIHLFATLSALSARVTYGSAENFLSNLYEQRFQRLVERGVLLTGAKAGGSSSSRGDDVLVVDEDVKRWSAAVSNIIMQFREKTWETWVGNFVEGLLLTIAGEKNAGNMGQLLQDLRSRVDVHVGGKGAGSGTPAEL